MLCNKGLHTVPAGATGGRCKECQSEYNRNYGAEYRKTRRKEAADCSRAWAINNPEKRRLTKVAYMARVKSETFGHYGGSCACCGLDDTRFLTLDHIDGNGGEERRAKYGTNKGARNTIVWAYGEFRKTGAWRTDLQLLCWNCNCAKWSGPWCPHEEPLPCQI